MVFKEYNENAGASRDPMRAVQTKRLLYLFNPWSNGQRVMATATTGTQTYRRMAQLAETDPKMAARHDLYRYRVVEELYDVVDDPNCLVNLIDSPARQGEVNGLRSALEAWMVKTGDHMLDTYRHRDDPAAREAYVQQKEQEAQQRRQGNKAKAKKAQSKATLKKRSDLIALEVPDSVTKGNPLTVKLHHKLDSGMGQQLVHVTLKAGPDFKRLERKVVTVSGEGTTEVTFDIPAALSSQAVRVAAFIGKDYANSGQHLQTAPLPVR
jgi:hypothetical protein